MAADVRDDNAAISCFGLIDRRTQEGSSRLHALLYACHPRLVNGYPLTLDYPDSLIHQYRIPAPAADKCRGAPALPSWCPLAPASVAAQTAPGSRETRSWRTWRTLSPSTHAPVHTPLLPPPFPPLKLPTYAFYSRSVRKCARNNSLWFFPLCLAFVAVLVLVRSRVWESANLRPAAWRTAGRTWRTAGALRKASVRRGTQPRKAAKSLSGALAAPFPNNRRRVVALGGWRFRVGEVSRRGAFCVQGRVYWWEACASAPERGFAASGGCETRRTVVRQPGPEPWFWCARDAVTRLLGRVFGRSGGCRPGR